MLCFVFVSRNFLERIIFLNRGTILFLSDNFIQSSFSLKDQLNYESTNDLNLEIKYNLQGNLFCLYLGFLLEENSGASHFLFSSFQCWNRKLESINKKSMSYTIK